MAAGDREPIPQDPYVLNVGEAAHTVQEIIPGFRPYAAIALGSGLGGLSDHIENATVIPYSKIPNMPESTAEGHTSQLVAGTISGVNVIAFNRRHLYESGNPDDVAFHVHLAANLGAKIYMTTNAAGGINADYKPGDLMIIRDHMSLFLLGGLPIPHHPFPGMAMFNSQAGGYTPELRELLKQCLPQAKEGILTAVPGPQYEPTPDVLVLRKLGADASGMSTIIEMITARNRGLDRLGLTVVTNATKPNGENDANHLDVTAVGKKVESELVPAFIQFFAKLKVVRNL